MGNNNNKNEQNDTFLYFLVFINNLLMFLSGITLSWSSPVLPKLQDSSDNPLGRIITESEASWIGSLPSLGACLGPLLLPYSMDRWGRKISILISSVPFIVAFTTLAFATDVNVYYFARFLSGTAMGSAFTVTPLYVVEVARSANRGLLASSVTCSIIGGILFCYCIGPYTSIMAFNLIFAAISVLFAVVFFFLAPETPYYLTYHNLEEKAKESLIRVRRHDKVEKELEEIKLHSKVEKGSIKDLFTNRAGVKAFLLANGLYNLQQFSGINVILAYTQNIFSNSAEDMDEAIPPIICGLVQFVTSPVTPLLSDRLGRRKLLLFSITGVVLTNTAFGTYYYLDDRQDLSSVSWLPIALIVIYFIFFNSGFGSLPSVVISELFPHNVKSIGCSITNINYFLIGFLLQYFFSSFVSSIGTGGTFWLFAGVSLFTNLFVYFFLPETAGKTLQEIQDILSK